MTDRRLLTASLIANVIVIALVAVVLLRPMPAPDYPDIPDYGLEISQLQSDLGDVQTDIGELGKQLTEVTTGITVPGNGFPGKNLGETVAAIEDEVGQISTALDSLQRDVRTICQRTNGGFTSPAGC